MLGRSGAVFLNQGCFAREGDVNGVGREHEKERLVFVLANEVFTGLGFEFGAELIGLRLQCLGGVAGDPVFAGKVRAIDPEIVVIALVPGTELGVHAEVPLADVAGGVAGFFHLFRHSDGIERQGHGGLRVNDALEGAPVAGDVGGDADTGLILSGLNGAAGGGADGSGGVSVGEAHSLAGELVEARRIDEVVAVTAEVAPAHVIDKDEDDVGLRRMHRGADQAGEGEDHGFERNHDEMVFGRRGFWGIKGECQGGVFH